MAAANPLALRLADDPSFSFREEQVSNEQSAPLSQHKESSWWKDAVCYQIWPASFLDSNGDGIGDIPGILTKLDYLKDLGATVIWLSPMYASPLVDMGYDISDYNAINPQFGSMEDMDALIAGLHKRGMKLILDLVVNHTSDQHQWFQESRKAVNAQSDTGNEYKDWYIWKDPKITKDETGREVRSPPNNWGAWFGGSAWEYAEERDQYYLHLFERRMPDLNWENPTTRKAIHDSAIRFWFEKGVDGFRVDTCGLYSKVQTFPDAPVEDRTAPYGQPGKFVMNGPRIHEFYREIRTKVLNDFGDPMMVGELGGTSLEEILRYISPQEGLSMVFDFYFAVLGGVHTRPWHEMSSWDLPEMKSAFEKTESLGSTPGGWNTVFAENHDLPRSISRFGSPDPQFHDKSAKLLAILTGTMSGTLFLYQGQEIGMTNIPETWGPEDLRDVNSLNYWKRMVEQHPKDKAMLRKAWLGIVAYSRDNARTPVQWSDSENAGFTTADTPWMRVNDNYTQINVAAQLGKKSSVHNFWKKMLGVRASRPDLFVHGTYHVHDYEDLDTFVFEKKNADKSALIMLNFSAQPHPYKVPKSFQGKSMKCVIANEDKPTGELGPWEGRVYVEH